MISSLLHWVAGLEVYFQSMGFSGVLLYAGLFFVVQFCLAPVAPLGLMAGVIFGFRNGILAASLGTWLGVAVNFLVARYLARGLVSRWLERSPKFAMIDEAIGREGWKIIVLLRFCPLPFGISNFCYGLTAIPFWPYFIASAIAITPANCFFVWLGTSAHESAEALLGGGRPRHPMEYVLLGVGLLAGLAALTYIGRIARKAVATARIESSRAD